VRNLKSSTSLVRDTTLVTKTVFDWSVSTFLVAGHKVSNMLYQLLYSFFWVSPWRLNFIRRRFGPLSLFHLHRQVGILHTHLPMKMEQTQCSKMSKCQHIKFRRQGITQKEAYNIQNMAKV